MVDGYVLTDDIPMENEPEFGDRPAGCIPEPDSGAKPVFGALYDNVFVEREPVEPSVDGVIFNTPGTAIDLIRRWRPSLMVQDAASKAMVRSLLKRIDVLCDMCGIVGPELSDAEKLAWLIQIMLCADRHFVDSPQEAWQTSLIKDRVSEEEVKAAERKESFVWTEPRQHMSVSEIVKRAMLY